MDKNKLYNIVDSFLVEAQDQEGNYRSLDRLNQDRHLVVESLNQLFELEHEKIRQNIGMLRQWLDERTSKELITNEEIEHWLIGDDRIYK